jgi:hypothetical protein
MAMIIRDDIRRRRDTLLSRHVEHISGDRALNESGSAEWTEPFPRPVAIAERAFSAEHFFFSPYGIQQLAQIIARRDVLSLSALVDFHTRLHLS